MAAGAVRRVRARVDGTVQGVGYRPFVYRLAHELGIAGWVLNDERGVLVEAEGPAEAVAALVRRLSADAPPLADVRGVTSEELPVTGGAGFQIVASSRSGAATAPVTPDTATCADCLAELADPQDRRFRYPFLNCTNCGPRFTIVRGIPYDRPTTTMADFAMCAACQAEYEDPMDRRFHAQPNACPVCGPQARLLECDGTPVAGVEDAVRAAADDLLAGRVLAVKGLGGYHLACRADDERAVSTLRSRKHREDRPFALLVADLAGARALATLGEAEAALLSSRQRPIVLATRLPDAPVAPSVAPRAPELGLMLPYTPLHQLLAQDAGVALVMTSGNVSDEPIAFEDDDAQARLGAIADRLLVHDRPIATRTDDSVARVVRERPLLLRRSRGFVPASLDLPLAARQPLLGCGAEQKAAFCLADGTRAWVSHHIGDIKNYETLRSLQDGVSHFERLFEVTPQVVAHDLHPDYLSTRYALEREGVALLGVQHHHAHLAATLAEHGETGPAVGAIYDGTGYGTDGTIWGGELLVGGLHGYERAGHLRAVRMPGGERAIRQPWRMALAWLVELHGEDVAVPPALAGIDGRTWRAVVQMVATQTSAPLTTSMGRLFDGVAALCGVRSEVSYEGQAAIELEALADPGADGAYALALVVDPDGGPAILDPGPTIDEILAELGAGVDVGTVSARFHAAVANATAAACERLAGAAGVETTVLSGGVFQNRLLLERTATALERAGLRVLAPERLPPNDGQIAFGQVAVAAAQAAG
ncbi:MAG TPA: carbamoyltransferase HypF [Solirubrobacteraceae bacterium]|jgi:hydrogenase maturation protein HypF|nr:carbamoyltransferase HypF [Solirubrobacteraceae bacterium]